MTIVTEREDDEETNKRLRKPLCTCILSDPCFLFDRLEKIPDKYEIPDWVEEEDRKAKEKKKIENGKSKKRNNTNTAKQKNKSQKPQKPSLIKEIPAKNVVSIRQDKNSPNGEVNQKFSTHIHK